MFLYLANRLKKAIVKKAQVQKFSHLISKNLRKEKLSPLNLMKRKQDIGAFLFAPLRGTLTVEAALILPFFLFVMISVMQYINVVESGTKFGATLSEMGKKLAMTSYVMRYGGDTEGAAQTAAGALSAVYVHNRVLSQAGNPSCVKKSNMVLSSFLQEEETIDLVLTYQMRSPLSIVKLPANFFIQRARVRAWTGRTPPSQGSDEEDGETSGDYVYVTETGSVYHEDANCTHLNLSIQEVDISALSMLRNRSGGIYHTCEKCGGAAENGRVYITKEGDRYHSSLNCSGLKRTVRQVSREELGNIRACSKCGGS